MKKKKYTHPRSESEQKAMNIKVLIGTIIVTMSVVLIATYVG